MSTGAAERYAEALALVDDAAHVGATARLLGGAAIFAHCPRATATGPYRELADIDVVTTGGDAPALNDVLVARGWTPDARFNALHGDRRMIFSGPVGKLDVFVDVFEMCHAVRLSDRLALEPRTLPVADLLVTKLQIVELNAKDAQDAAALLAEHELGRGPGDHVDLDRLDALVAGDWGLWRTLTGTLHRLGELEPQVAGAADRLIAAIAATPKTRGWRLRARIGERKRWYELPDELG